MIRSIVRRRLPEAIMTKVRAYRNKRQIKQLEGLSDKEIFDKIYHERLWGAETEGAIRSGTGSTPKQSEPYEDLVADFIDQSSISNVLDFGCGNFQVSERIYQKCRTKPSFTGIDISEVVIAHNQERYGGTAFRFIRDDGNFELPYSNLVTVRQVLQHNSNENILKILSRVRNRCSHLIIAEHVPQNPKEINLDFPTSMLTRMTIQSGVFVEESPFKLPVDRVIEIDWTKLGFGDGVLRVTFSKATHLASSRRLT